MWEFEIKSSTCFFFSFSLFFLRSYSSCILLRLFSQAGCECLHVPDHLSGTLSGYAAWPQGQTGCTSASSRYLACWHPRKILHGLTRPRSAERKERGRETERKKEGDQTLISISPGYCVQTLTNHIPPTEK